MLCYIYTKDMIFITSFLKSNINYIQLQDQLPPPSEKFCVPHLPAHHVSYLMGSGGVKLAIHLRLKPRSSIVWSYNSTPPHIFVKWLIKHGDNSTSAIPKDLSNSRSRRFITSSTKVRHWIRHWAPSPFIHTLSLRSGLLWMFALTWNRSTILWTSSP